MKLSKEELATLQIGIMEARNIIELQNNGNCLVSVLDCFEILYKEEMKKADREFRKRPPGKRVKKK